MQNDTKIYTLENILGAELPREEAIALIKNDADAWQRYCMLQPNNQEKILGFIQGNQGLKILHDNFSQHVLNPENHPERLEGFLSALLGQKVKIVKVLSRMGNTLVDKGSFVVLDFLVELSDCTRTNVEIQRIGYAFPGERSSCYIADSIMRQYNEVHAEKGEKFSFRDMKPVLLVILMESSPKVFTDVSPIYIHRERHSYDSGAHVTNLSKIIYISLDTFHSVVQNINTELDAWLTFFSSDEPADIVKLVNTYPEFLSCYKDIMEFRRHPKEVVAMYSEALYIMDRNLERYMVEEKQKELDAAKQTIAEQEAALSEQAAQIAELKAQLAAAMQK
jgi:hypothetical protein